MKKNVTSRLGLDSRDLDLVEKKVIIRGYGAIIENEYYMYIEHRDRSVFREIMKAEFFFFIIIIMTLKKFYNIFQNIKFKYI